MPKIDNLNHPLTNKEIEDILPGINIVPYFSIPKYKTVQQLCDNKYNSCFILYINDKPEPNTISGHWCLVYKPPNKKCVYLFDPYGQSYMDNNLVEIGPTRKQFMEESPYLSELILNDPNIDEVYFNSNVYQELKEDISTCGKHCIIRCVFFNMGYLKEEDYKKALDILKRKLKQKNYDNLVNYLIKKNI